MVVTAAQFKSIPKAKHYARAMSNVLRAAQHLFEVEAKAMLLGAKGEANLVKARSRLQLATSRLIVSGLDGKLKNTGEVSSKDLEPKWLTEARSEVSEASPEVVDCACRLISGVVKEVEARGGSTTRPTMEIVYKDNQSHILVVWGRDLNWVVSPNGKPWPVVNVKLYGSLSALCSKRTRSTQGTQDLTQANWVVSRSLELLGYLK